MDVDEAPQRFSESPLPTTISNEHTIRSPLSLDLHHQTLLLLNDLNLDPVTPTASASPGIPQIIFDYAIETFTPSAGSAYQLLDALSLLAAHDGISQHVLYRFRPLALDILARWLVSPVQLPLDSWTQRLIVLAGMADLEPELWSLITAFLLCSPFRSSPLSHFHQDQLVSSPSETLQPLLLAYLRLLVADPKLAHRLEWPITPLHALRTHHPDLAVRLLAIQVLSKQRRWSEEKRMEMEREWVGDVATLDVEILYGHEVVKLERGGFELKRKVVDGWVLAMHEAQRTERYRKRMNSADEHAYLGRKSVDTADLCSRTALVADTLLLRSSQEAAISSLIHVPTRAATSALHALLQPFQLGIPILVTSPPSSGKTHLLHHLSATLYPSVQPTSRILTIPLADTTIDVKSLLGTYVSSPTRPGSFEWMEGALAKAVRAGRWVVFDDIDRASMEMLVTISGLARSLKKGRTGRRAVLPIPGREEIEAGDGFALFATRTTRLDTFTPPTYFGHHNFTEIILESPTDDDILHILSAQFDRLPHSVTRALVDVWRDLRPLAKVGGQVKGRDIGLRDLEKWCARVQDNLPPSASIEALERAGGGVLANPVFQDEVLLEAADTFLASLDSRSGSREKRAKMVQVIAEKIGMDEERAAALLDSRRPQLEIASSTKQLRIGRATLPITSIDKRRFPASDRPFALTRPSLTLLEQTAAAVNRSEPLLLVGETGTGKTTAVQHIAMTCRRPLTVLNLSTQTETSDLVGGFKPIDASVQARGLHARWQGLFAETFSTGKKANGAYLEAAQKALQGGKWGRCVELWSGAAKRALDKLEKKDDDGPDTTDGNASPRKRRKIANKRAQSAAVQWQSLVVEISEFDLHHVKMKSKLVFSFVEGPLVEALKNGEWILLDEVNLASQETLEAISTLLEGSGASLVLTDRGDVEPIPRHPNFRLFACMNPATDVGKKDLPPSLRSRFTELYVPPPDDDREALIAIVSQYLSDAAAGDRPVILDVAEMYTALKRLSSAKEIVDGSNAPPHFSMRTLARALMFAVETAAMFGLRRALWEGCLMAFTMSLDKESVIKAREVCEKYLLGPMRNARAALSQIPSLPSGVDQDDHVRFGAFWLRRGPLPPTSEDRYVITPSVQAKLSDLARVILTHRYPVLIQGPTSAGKTSAVEFLARQTGHRFVRINNHEHTDIQEYLGTYVTDPAKGNLVFQEGLLVTAVRQGHWIVLDELNLAPTDVLEALNRLLDDNHELVIPETQEVIKPHPNFILFATQNPPGLYAGRKVLSRAFRNRFLEVHFDDVPRDELETILCQRCEIAPTYAKRIVQVFDELRHRRQASRVFESKTSFATLRDLFRWAERGAVGYQQLAEDGYMLLAERARSQEDKNVIRGVIEDIMKVSIDTRQLYDLSDLSVSRLPFDRLPDSKMVWTRAMQRLFTLVAAALKHNEPVLLVGETGCGKTSVCEVVARAFGQEMVGVNCHQNMETADLLGSQRPVRNREQRRAKVVQYIDAIEPTARDMDDDGLLKLCRSLLASNALDTAALQQVDICVRELKALSALFEWSDGPLVHAMTAGTLLLLDEVSLADDSVLERLNSVLEPGRTLVLAEKGGSDIDAATISAHPSFHVVATMNPGGDFGKKELSPALRNRFTEIWVPALDDREDLMHIVGKGWKFEELAACSEGVLSFLEWFGERVGDRLAFGLRDILAWVEFANHSHGQGKLSTAEAFHHGGQMVVVDGLESLHQVSGLSTASISVLRQECLEHLDDAASAIGSQPFTHSTTRPQVSIESERISIGGFAIPRGSLVSENSHFRFEAPTTALNAMRVLRGCQLPKAILLEGSPGVGKTSLVAALASVAGHRLQRINLSDQTDLIDLFGSDLPVEGGQPGEFQWRDAAFLDAMQKGDWVLLDEMNLASQTVLEGLNAVLDHRGTVFIPELGRSFERHPDFRVFAAQNPLQQGGGRKGLPKSFLNRFTKVYLQEHTPADLEIICRDLTPLPQEMVSQMISFNEVIREKTMTSRTIGREGSPWEFNLRDLFRWFKLLSSRNGLELSSHPLEYLALVYLQRFRNESDRDAVSAIAADIFGVRQVRRRATPVLTPSWLQIGHSLIRRGSTAPIDPSIAHDHLDVAESLLKCVEVGWLVILAGDSGAGKRSIVRGIAEAAGRKLGEFEMHPGVVTSEILGSFEQQDFGRLLDQAYHRVKMAGEASSDEGDLAIPNLASLKAAYTAAKAHPIEELPTFLAVAQRIVSTSPSAHTALEALVRASPSSVGFAWIDGQLLDAIRNGGWFLISDANLCSASVLDRLNSLCETDGVLVMSEKGSSSGQPEVIKPHPEFRLFMTYDPKYGELSRAMRNRGVELHVDRARSGKAMSAVTADHALLRSAMLLHGEEDRGVAPASVVANSVAMQSSRAHPLLRRLPLPRADLYQAISSFLSGIPSPATTFSSIPVQDFLDEVAIDASLNPNVSQESSDIGNLFRALQILLRNKLQQGEIKGYLDDSANSKTVLAISAANIGRRSRKRNDPGMKVYPYLASIRAITAERLAAVTGMGDSAVDAVKVESLEKVLVFLELLEGHAKSTVFDYSATQLLGNWISEEDCHLSILGQISKNEASLTDVLNLTTGFGQSEIWSLFRGDGARSIVEELDEDTRTLLENQSDPQIRFSLLQALVSTPVDGLAELRDAMPDLHSSLKAFPNDEKWSDWPVLASSELTLLKKAFLGQRIDSGLGLLVGNIQVSPLSLVPLARLALPAPILADKLAALQSWMSRLWEHDGANPSSLFCSSGLASVLRFSGQHTVSLAEIPKEEAALDFSVRRVISAAHEDRDLRNDAVFLALSMLETLLVPFGIILDLRQGLQGVVTQMQDATRQMPSWLRETQVFDAGLQRLAQDSRDLSSIGLFWLTLADFLFLAYVTNMPIDPAVRRVLQGEVIARSLLHLEEELQAVEAAEIATKGIADSQRLEQLRKRRDSLYEEQAGLGASIDRPTDAARLSILFHEVTTFLDDLILHGKLRDLAKAVQSAEIHAGQREESFQLVSAAFLRRLSTTFSDLADLVQPIAAAILCAKFGLRVVARGAELERKTSSSLVSALLRYPTVSARSDIQRMFPIQDDVRQLSLVSAAFATETGSDQERATQLATFAAQLNMLYQAWSAARTREQQEAQDAESLYRVRKTDIEVLSEEDQEAKELAELFPTYDDADESTDSLPTANGHVDSSPSAKFGPADVQVFHDLLMAVHGPNRDDAEGIFVKLSDILLPALFKPADHDEHLDKLSIVRQIRLLHDRRVSRQKATMHANFYLSPNEAEIQKAFNIVDRLVRRLTVLIDDWPEQMVLQHIRDRCDRLLLLNVRSPVAQILSAMEQLLIHTDDWEAYANRDNTLKTFQAEMSSLIIDWRRLELSSWMRLLDDQAKQYVDADSEWTLRLFGAIMQGTMTSEDIEGHCKEVLPMVSTYLKSSSLGRFASRLSLLSTFERMTDELAPLDPSASSKLSRMSNLLHNIVANAQLYAPGLAESLATRRAALDKSIKDFVKLASWKDVNVFALKASAQKSHKHLHRSIRKFRELLQQPVAPILADISGVVPQDSGRVSSGANLVTFFEVSKLSPDVIKESPPGRPEHLVHLDHTLVRYTSALDKARPADSVRLDTKLEEMAVEIIETSQSLAKATPANLTKENTKLVNNLASRKRKAFADLLKALRASGFSNSVRADQLAKQQSTFWLATRPHLATEHLPERFDVEVIKKVEGYHHRMTVMMDALRAAFNGHNPDIASADLQRGIGFTESVLAAALVERERASGYLFTLGRLTKVLSRLEACSNATALDGGEEVLQQVVDAELSTRRLSKALQEAQQAIHLYRGLQGATATSADLETIIDLDTDCAALINRLSHVTTAARESGCPLFRSDELDMTRQARTFRDRLVTDLVAQADRVPELAHCLRPVADFARGMSTHEAGDRPRANDADVSRRSDELIQTLLVVIQRLEPITSKVATSEEQDDIVHVPAAYAQQTKYATSLRLPEVLDRVLAFVASLVGCRSTVAPSTLARLLPFLQALADSYARAVSTHLHWVKSTYKLTYVVGRIMLDLAQKGFCKPQEEGDSSGKDGEDGDAVEGTGMGAGTGEKNVSGEIEEEGQVEGLQGEEEEQEGEGEEKDEDDAVSMGEDFEGRLGEGNEQEEDGGSGDEDEDDHDEHVGDVDPLEPGAVDEKFWEGGNEEKEEDKGGREELADQQAKEQEGQSEMAAKEKEGKEGKKDDDNKKEEEGESQDEGEAMGDLKDFENEGEDLDGDEAEEAGEQESKVQDEVALPEGDRLDLPEDLDFGEEQGEDGDQGENIDEDIALPAEDEEDGPEKGDGDDASMASQDDGEEQEDGPGPTGVTEDDAEEMQEETMNQDIDVSASNDAQAPESADVGGGGGGNETKEREQEEAEEGKDKEAVEEQEGQPEGKGAAPQQSQAGASSDQKDVADGPADSTGAPLPADGSAPPQPRSLGDILKDIRRRRDEILAQQERENQPPTGATDAEQQAPGQVEHVGEEDQDEGQALGKADAEAERQKLEDMTILEEEDAVEDDGRMPGMEDDGAEDVDAETGKEGREPHERVKHEETREGGSKEKALTQADIAGGAPKRPGEEAGVDELDEDGIERIDPPREEVIDAEDIDIVMGEAPSTDLQAASGEDSWRHYASLTSDLSYALCEQLRLILEPTLATRLQGDFRTGKRLNMRKIIPYIASEYTKDKIWLRRTKPSRREYQVLLSLDDSRSMAESHSVSLAYQTLALVGQALNKLEVGQVAIAKFGERVDILHPFGDRGGGGFSDADGAKVMSAFKFDQQRTDVVALVERTLSFLAEARQTQTASSSSAPDLWQLQIIISDGVCQDHERLRVLLRRAIEERVMIVFIVVDSLHTQTVSETQGGERPSILQMQTVEYKLVNGEMKLEMARYLDTFPFEFFVVLRDVEALPGVLADTLRQWMARVSQSNE